MGGVPTHHDLLVSLLGIKVGANEIWAIDEGGNLYQLGVKVTATAAELNQLAGSGVVKADLTKLHAITKTAAELNALPIVEQDHVADVGVTAAGGIDGADTVGKAAVLAALNALQNKMNAVLAALEAANILADA